MEDMTQDKNMAVKLPTISLQDIIEGLVRIVGGAIMIVGIVMVFQVFREVTELAKSHAPIVAFADEVEKVTNINKAANNFMTETLERMRLVAQQVEGRPIAQPQPWQPVNIAYFAAWSIKILLLIIIGWLGFSALGAGGKVALTGMGDRRHARTVAQALAKEMAELHMSREAIIQVTQHVIQELKESQGKG